MFTAEALFAVLERMPRAPRYWVAFSGGPDSHVLLHACAQLRARLAPAELCAVHVDHGLHEHAAQWARQARAMCDALGVPCTVIERRVVAPPGASLEEQARIARYEALAERLAPGEVVLTAHHCDDQAETVLLRALRGAGVAGLGAMRECRPLGPGWLVRPLLGFSRAQLRAYAEAHGLESIEDHTNADLRFDRNYLRHEILPRLAERWPAAARTLARAAAQLAEAAELLDEYGAADLAAIVDPGDRSLRVSALQDYGPARRRHLLRAWLHACGLPPPSRAQLHAIQEQVLAARWDRTPVVHWSGAEVRRYRDRLYAMTPLPAHDPTQVVRWDLRNPLALPAAGVLFSAPAEDGGLRADLAAGGEVTVRFRHGGEHCRPAGQRHHRSLKKLLQESSVPPWLRDRIPVVYVGDAIAAVPGVVVCEPFQARSGQAARRLFWHLHGAPS